MFNDFDCQIVFTFKQRLKSSKRITLVYLSVEEVFIYLADSFSKRNIQLIKSGIQYHAQGHLDMGIWGLNQQLLDCNMASTSDLQLASCGLFLVH